MKSSVGIIGLGTMGGALARNIASRGIHISLWNRTQERIGEFIKEFGSEFFYAPTDFNDFVDSLEKPRRLILMLPAGDATLDMVHELIPKLETGDCIMDGGNAFYEDTQKIQSEVSKKSIHYLGTGISGGAEGALHGPSIMPGGSKEAWDAFRPILEKIAADDFNGKACVSYMGTGGAGHYVKMVHNGIEYAEMQTLSEAYDLLHELYKLDYDEIAQIFQEWDDGPLSSFLTQISVEVLKKTDSLQEGTSLLAKISDQAAQKGTGKWTSEEAIKLGIAVPSITMSVFARGISMQRDARTELSKLYPVQEKSPNMTLSDFKEHLKNSMIMCRILNFEQGFSLLKIADSKYGYGLNFSEIARIWQGGCIIRSSILKEIKSFFDNNGRSLLFADFSHRQIVDSQKSLRLVVSIATEHSIPTLALSSSLNYFDSFRRFTLPTNFIQGLRDRFGSHGYERIDKEGIFHTDWL